MKVAAVQFRASTDKDANLERIISYIGDAADAGAQLCAFPEFMMFYTDSGQTPEQLAEMAETIRGGFVRAVARAAADHGIQVVGSFYERSGTAARVYDTSFVTSTSGRILSTYRKIHLYDALGFKESDKMIPGSRIARPARTPAGRIGMLICYDLRFPEMSRSLAGAGAEILVAPSAWVRGDMKEEHWVVINRTRAIENGCYVIAPDQVGNIYCGRTMIVDPYGRILLDMKKTQGIGFAEVDPDVIKKTRRMLPLLSGRRTDVYTT